MTKDTGMPKTRHGPKEPPRRTFLKAGLAAAAGAAAGDLAARAEASIPKPAPAGAVSLIGPPVLEPAQSPDPGHTGLPPAEGLTIDEPMPGVPPVVEPPGAPADEEVPYKTFDLDLRIVRHSPLPGVEVHTLAFNGRVPGPTIRVNEGDWVKVRFKNRTELLHTIHWHGLDVPYTMDGVPWVTQNPVMPGQTFIYRFQARPPGTRFYHCHFGTLLHMQSGMFGAFIIEREDDPIRRRFPYTRDYVLILTSWDINFMREEMNAMLRRMKERMLLMRLGKLDPQTQGVFRTYGEFQRALETGYIPPYTTARLAGEGLATLDFNFFAINGRCYPATEPLYIRTGEWIRIRLINTGQLEHYMHLHGHQFYIVAEDGNDLPEPVEHNTVRVSPGKTADIVVYGNNPGYWTLHDHDTRRVTNNGIYPGGMLTVLAYEDADGPYVPKVALDE